MEVREVRKIQQRLRNRRRITFLKKVIPEIK